jgi:hypothetical protein
MVNSSEVTSSHDDLCTAAIDLGTNGAIIAEGFISGFDQMDGKQAKRFLGQCPDVVVMGKPLHEWEAGETGKSTEEMFEWKRAVEKTTGRRFEEAVGPAMAIRFEVHFEMLADAEHRRGLLVSFEEGARSLGYENPKAISSFEVNPTDGSPRRVFAGIRAGDSQVIIGLDEGRWRVFAIAELLQAAGLSEDGVFGGE